MIEYHAYILGPDGKIISRHNLFCNEVGSALVEAAALVGADGRRALAR